MGFAFGRGSQRNLVGAHPDLVTVLDYGIKRTSIDFSIYDGGRTREEQAGHVASGASLTMDSRHLVDKLQLHYAVDLAPWIKGAIDWTPSKYIPIFEAIFEGAAHYGIPLMWGAYFETLADYNHIALDRTHYPAGSNVSTFESRRQAGYKLITNKHTGKYERTEFFKRAA